MKQHDKLKSLLTAKAKTIDLDSSMITVSSLTADGNGPLLYVPAKGEMELASWLRQNRDEVNKQIYKHGAILFRGFNINSPEIFRETVLAVNDELMEYVHRSSPRTQVSDKVYTSTDHPADQVINMHNEMCYAVNWPMKIIFGCMQSAVKGGETPVADSRRVYNAISRDTIEVFRAKGVKYVRNLGAELGLAWQEVFQTTDKNEIDAVCGETGMQAIWIDDEHLRLEWTRPAIREHPVTGEDVWFNHAYFFNSATLDISLRKILDHERLPFNTYYGDGTVIPEAVIGELANAFSSNLVVFQWQIGDFLLLDNMLMAHGRMPFEGSRKIVVAMNEPHHK